LKARGFFITLEGIDGAGKTAQFRRLVRYLRRRGYKVCATREPGGTRIGERIRDILVAGRQPARGPQGRRKALQASVRKETLAPMAELELMYAARAQHLAEVIRPALQRGEIVVSDRYNDSSFAYQGYGRRLGEAAVREIDRAVCGDTQPDLTLVLDLDPRLALSRALRRDARESLKPGRFEAEGLSLQQRVRAGYRALARREPGRVRLIRSDRPHDEVEAEIRQVVEEWLRARRSGRLGYASTSGTTVRSRMPA
jgi:dTMP kinase